MGTVDIRALPPACNASQPCPPHTRHTGTQATPAYNFAARPPTLIRTAHPHLCVAAKQQALVVQQLDEVVRTSGLKAARE
eukprot:229099-Chlamydomonas_euryale.AAC.16